MADNSLEDMLSNAMKDPSFMKIFSSLKEKAESGELDVSSVLSGEGFDGLNADGITDNTKEKESGDGIGTKGVSKKENKADMTNHKRLISALRPYLSEGKRSAVDSILKLGDMSELFGSFMKGGK